MVRYQAQAEQAFESNTYMEKHNRNKHEMVLKKVNLYSLKLKTHTKQES